VRETNVSTCSSHLEKPLPHSLRPRSDALGKPAEVAFANPLANAVLQHVPRPRLTALDMPHAPMQRHALRAAAVHAAVQNVVVVEDQIPRRHFHNLHAGQALCEWISTALGVRPRPPVRARHDHEAGVIEQREVPLRVPGRLVQPRALLSGGGLRRDVVAVPTQREVAVGPHQQVVELHDQVIFGALEQLRGGADDRVAEVRRREYGL